MYSEWLLQSRGHNKAKVENKEHFGKIKESFSVTVAANIHKEGGFFSVKTETPSRTECHLVRREKAGCWAGTDLTGSYWKPGEELLLTGNLQRCFPAILVAGKMRRLHKGGRGSRGTSGWAFGGIGTGYSFPQAHLGVREYWAIIQSGVVLVLNLPETLPHHLFTPQIKATPKEAEKDNYPQRSNQT